jgi:hypothetical protein
MKGMTTTRTGSIAKLPGNDPMILSMQEIFPALDTAVVQSIYTNKFQAANLLKLKASFTNKKNRATDATKVLAKQKQRDKSTTTIATTKRTAAIDSGR